MTSLYVICGLGPPIKTPAGYAYGRCRFSLLTTKSNGETAIEKVAALVAALCPSLFKELQFTSTFGRT